MKAYRRNAQKQISQEEISTGLNNYKKLTLEGLFLKKFIQGLEPLEIINRKIFEEISENTQQSNKNLALISYRN